MGCPQLAHFSVAGAGGVMGSTLGSGVGSTASGVGIAAWAGIAGGVGIAVVVGAAISG